MRPEISTTVICSRSVHINMGDASGLLHPQGQGPPAMRIYDATGIPLCGIRR
jgi:hypothetical protein